MKYIPLILVFLFIQSIYTPAKAHLYINPIPEDLNYYDKDTGEKRINEKVYALRNKKHLVKSIEFDTKNNKYLILTLESTPHKIDELGFYVMTRGGFELIAENSIKLKKQLEMAIESEHDYFLYTDYSGGMLAKDSFIFDTRLNRLSKTSEFQVLTPKEKLIEFYDSLSINEKAREIGKKIQELIDSVDFEK